MNLDAEKLLKGNAPIRTISFYELLKGELKEKGTITIHINVMPKSYQELPSNLIYKLRTRDNIHATFQRLPGGSIRFDLKK